MKVTIVLVLQVLTTALTAAQRVHGADAVAMTKVWHPRESGETGSARGAHGRAEVGDDKFSPAWLRNHGNEDDEGHKFFGGRHNDSIPSLGANRRNVGLLLEPSDQESDQLQGCISVAIAPRFFLTRASCVRFQQNVPLMFIEVTEKSGKVTRHSFQVKNSTMHPDFMVNLAVVEVEDKENVLIKNVKPMLLNAYTAEYYRRDESLSLVSIDNIFNPSLAMNAQSIDKLIRVPVSSCQYNSDPSTIHCFAPADLANRQMTFEFAQGMLLHKSQSLVGLPDCEGLCSGGIFYSATYLASHRGWIDDITSKAARWFTLTNSMRKVSVPPEQEPTYVSLYSSLGADAEPVCSGALIAPRFVLTTASCATKHSVTIARMNHGERVTVVNGHEDTIPIVKVSTHPQFRNTTNLSNDLAVLQLSAPTIYTPTILASDDALDKEANDVVGCQKPRRSRVDSSVMCLPPLSVKNEDSQLGERKLADDLDLISFQPEDFDNLSLGSLVTVTPPGDCQQSTIEQWNTNVGDGVFDVPETGSYFLLGLSSGVNDMTVTIADQGNHTEARMCSVNDTVGDDDNAALVIRLATPETIEFINAVSEEQTWQNPHRLPASIFEAKFARIEISKKAETFSIAYDGALVFDEPPKDMDLGFVVGLRFEKFGQNYCGGSLIAPSYVLTAAHCVGGDRAKFVSVGSHESKGAETELIPVKSSNIITHPLYGKRSMYSYDVAILELDSQAYPKPITLDNSRQLDPSTYLTLYGYGANSASSTVLSEVLRSVALPYFSRDKCKTKFPELDDSMFCAGGELARDACTGDSGSPLVRIVEGKPRLVGVVSSGRNGCGTPGVPGVYALVAEVQSFIDSVVAGNKWVDPGKRLSSAPATQNVKGGAGADGADSGSKGADPEMRTAESDGTVLRSADNNKTDVPFDVINMANGAVAHQLSLVEMAKDTPRGLQSALMEFLVGDFEHITGWRPQVDEHWKVAFYSTGDLTGLMKLIATHRAKPLYARTNRFARPAWGQETANSMISSAAACASGH